MSRDLTNFRILRTVCAHFAHSLRPVSGPEFPFLGVRKRGRGKNPRPPRNEFGPKSTLPANFFGARYRQKAVGSNANLRPSAAREIIMVTKERLGGGRRREKRRTGGSERRVGNAGDRNHWGGGVTALFCLAPSCRTFAEVAQPDAKRGRSSARPMSFV